MAGRAKVYVTGLGAVSCLGSSVEELWEALLCGSCGLRPLERFDLEGSPYSTAGQASGIEPVDFAGCGVSMGAQFAARAAREAVRDLPEESRDGLAVVLATNFGPSEALEALLDGESVATGQRRLRDGPFAWDVDHVGDEIGAGGERLNISLSCSSGNAALAHALELVRSKRADAVLAGGYDSIQKVVWAGLSCLRVMTAGKEGEGPRVQPFDRNRSGTLFSEGAGMLLLESAEHARARGTELLAELAGAGSNNNAHHMTRADEQGRAMAEVMAMALRDAGVGSETVGHVNAHGTGTKLNDAVESRALKKVLGSRAAEVPVTSLKGGLGHAMGAASALEAVASVLSLREGVIPPTVNYETPDPECDLDVVSGVPRQVDLETVLNNSAGIGGGNAAVVLRKVSLARQ